MTEVGYDLKNICQLLQRDGYVHLRSCIPLSDIESAIRAINFEIGEGISKEDMIKMRINAISFGTNRLRQSKCITDLFHNTCAARLTEQLYGIDNMHLPEYYTQIALRFPQDIDDDTICYHPWHLDNVQAGGIKGFGLIIGVFLNDTPKPDSGNFTVFPGAHIVLEKYFRKVGGSTSLYRHKYGKIILPDVDIGNQHQILAKAGDIVICHYQLPHRAAPNISSNIRMAVFFRIYHKHLPFEHPVDCNIRHFSMTNLWAIGWTGMKTNQSDIEILIDVDVPSLCDCDEKSRPKGLKSNFHLAIKFSHVSLVDVQEILKDPILSIQWIQGSKCSGTLQFWLSTRAFIINAINKSGTILDIGCANGFLLACLNLWLQQKSLTLVPYGIECDPSILQCHYLFPHWFNNNHFVQIDLNTFLSSPTKEAEVFPSQFDFIYWNVWDDGCDLKEDHQQRWLCKLCSMTSLGGKLLLGLYGTKENNDIKSDRIKTIIIQNFPYVNESHIATFKALDYPHCLLSIEVHSI